MRGSVSADIFVVDSARSARKPSRLLAKPKSPNPASKAGPRSGKIALLEMSPPGTHPPVPEYDDREVMSPFAGGNLAHEFNNLLTVILGHTEFLLKRDESKKVHACESLRSGAPRSVAPCSQSSFWRSRVARVLRQEASRASRTAGPNASKTNPSRFETHIAKNGRVGVGETSRTVPHIPR